MTSRRGQRGTSRALFRHRFAHTWPRPGQQRDRSYAQHRLAFPAMLRRYGASAADARAREAHRLRSPVDRL